jgi:hypothetical protein
VVVDEVEPSVDDSITIFGLLLDTLRVLLLLLLVVVVVVVLFIEEESVLSVVGVDSVEDVDVDKDDNDDDNDNDDDDDVVVVVVEAVVFSLSVSVVFSKTICGRLELLSLVSGECLR